MVQHWLEWAHLKAKVPKCRSMVVQASTGKRVTSDLSIGGKAIPVVDEDSFKFLGKPVRFYKSNRSAGDSIRQHLQQMLDAIDNTPLTCQQKLHLFRFGVCPRMSWPLLIEDLPISWLEREHQPLATTALKKWAGLARSSCTSILFLPVKQSGLAIPSLVGLYKRQQAACMVQLFTSSDPGVRKAADFHLVEERKSQRVRFKPATFVNELRAVDQPQS